MKERGFSLIELLVVMGIIAVLLSLSLSTIMTARRHMADFIHFVDSDGGFVRHKDNIFLWPSDEEKHIGEVWFGIHLGDERKMERKPSLINPLTQMRIIEAQDSYHLLWKPEVTGKYELFIEDYNDLVIYVSEKCPWDEEEE